MCAVDLCICFEMHYDECSKNSTRILVLNGLNDEVFFWLVLFVLIKMMTTFWQFCYNFQFMNFGFGMN